jgi:hypothetical protein
MWRRGGTCNEVSTPLRVRSKGKRGALRVRSCSRHGLESGSVARPALKTAASEPPARLRAIRRDLRTGSLGKGNQILRSADASGLRMPANLPRVQRPFRDLGNFMSNRAIWNVRLRHVWLATPLKGKRLKRRQRLRIGLEDALQRKAKSSAAEPAQTESGS